MTSCTLIILKITFFFVTFIPSTTNMMMHDHDHDHHFYMKPSYNQYQEILSPDHISTHHEHDEVIRVLHEEKPPSIADDRFASLPTNGGGIPPEILQVVMKNSSQEVVHDDGHMSARGSTTSKGNNSTKSFLNVCMAR